jgi:hypothetical protein
MLSGVDERIEEVPHHFCLAPTNGLIPDIAASQFRDEEAEIGRWPPLKNVVAAIALAHLGASLDDRTAADLDTIAKLRHAFLFGAMSTAEDRAVFFNPVAEDVRAAMRASRCEGLDCTFKAVKGVGAAV